jgi:hypothetical protein
VALERADLGLVQAQSFEKGREVLVGAPPHLETRLEQEGETGIRAAVSPAWKVADRTARAARAANH